MKKGEESKMENEMMLVDWTSERRKGKLIEIDYVRTFLGHEMIFVPIYQVLVFFMSSDISWGNPFMKSVMESIAYNGTKIIAYDNGPFQKSKEEYKTILERCGYHQIFDVVTAQELNCKTESMKFYKKMLETYNPQNKLCGMVGRHMNLYAKLKHMHFLVYSSPDIYPARNIYVKKNQTESIIERFINFQLFDGLRTETLGYHFGYSFAGIFMYEWALYIHKKANGKPLYFMWNARHGYEVYKEIFPKDKARIVYVDADTKNDKHREKYLQNIVSKEAGYFVNGDIRKRAKFEPKYHVIELVNLFSKKVLETYGNEIEQMLDEMTGHSVCISKIKEGQPHWKILRLSEEDEIKRHEVKQGYMDFIKEFHTFAKIHPRIQRELLENRGEFAAKAVAYGFDKKRQEKKHYNFIQLITETKKAKKCIGYARKIYRKGRRK